MAPSKALCDAKGRHDRLIRKARADLYKPIAVAEILYRDRVDGTIELSRKEDYRRPSYQWMLEIVRELHDKTTELNSRYWDQTFDEDVVPPSALVALGEANRQGNGVVECYVYWHIRDKFAGLVEIRDELKSSRVDEFDLKIWLSRFQEDARFRRSVDKAYEIVVYALFSAVTAAMDARVSLSVEEGQRAILVDFEEFAKMVLGLDAECTSVSQPAKLYRVGTANAADAGLDMWANFGPAVQVKHIALSADETGDICESVRADQLVIVCRSGDASAIQSVVSQLGLGEKLRGVITEDDLARWYALACSTKYCDSIGKSLLQAIVYEMGLEFPLTKAERVDEFFSQRDYEINDLVGLWAVGE